MNMTSPVQPLALIAGPTASGKSAVAIELAERQGGVVINADSAQVYADLRVLSARPSPDEEARVSHRLFGYIDGAESCSAARWAADARAEITAAHAAGRLPVVFVIEDNAYGISVSKRDCTAIPRNADRAVAYGMPGHFVPGNDADAVYDVAGAAIARARRGEGPSLIEIETHRLEGHFMGDAEGYRPDGEVARLKALDPIPRYRARLLADGFDAADLDRAEDDARRAVDAAFSAARAAAYPDPMEAYAHRRLTIARAISEAIGQEMAADPAVLVMGEDIAKLGGVFGTTTGLLDRFGAERQSDQFARAYDTGKEVSVTRNAPGSIKRLSVAVLLRDPETGKPRSPVEIQQITQLVQSAVGYDPSRNDQVTVISRKFAAASLTDDKQPWYESGWVAVIARNVTAIVIALLVLMMGVRPLARALMKRRDDAGPRLALGRDMSGGAGGNPGDPPVSVDAMAGARRSRSCGRHGPRRRGRTRRGRRGRLSAAWVTHHSSDSETVPRSSWSFPGRDAAFLCRFADPGSRSS
eukprot:gene28786-38049_t